MKGQGTCKLNTYCTTLIKSTTEQTINKIKAKVGYNSMVTQQIYDIYTYLILLGSPLLESYFKEFHFNTS